MFYRCMKIAGFAPFFYFASAFATESKDLSTKPLGKSCLYYVGNATSDTSDISDYIVSVVETTEVNSANNGSDGDDEGEVIPSDISCESMEKLAISAPAEASAAKKSSKLSDLIKGSKAVLLASAIVYPLDLRKIRRQGGVDASWKNFRPVIPFVRNTLYKGFTPYALAMTTSMGLNYAFYGELKTNKVILDQQWVSPYLAAGTIASMNATLLSNFLWVYRIQKSLIKPGALPYTPSTYAKAIIADPRMAFRSTPMGFFHSLSQGVYFYLYEKIKLQLKDVGQKEHQNTSMGSDVLRSFTASAAAKLTATAAVHPFDTVRINQQKFGGSAWHMGKSLFVEGGIKRFYFGIVPATSKSALAAAIHMSLYELQKFQANSKQTKP